MKPSYYKIISILLIIGLEITGLLALKGTVAYVSDHEDSINNEFAAGSVDFSLEKTGLESVEVAVSLHPGDQVFGTARLTDEGTLPFQYSGWSKQKSGDDFLCQQLYVVAKLEGLPQYTGSMQVFNFPTSTFIGSTANWTFDIFLPPDPPEGIQNMTCTFAFVFGARQLGSELPGYSDMEEVEYTATTGTWASDTEETVVESLSIQSDEVAEETMVEPTSTPSPSATPELSPSGTPSPSATPEPTPTPMPSPSPSTSPPTEQAGSEPTATVDA
jgi:hypothetical protein